MQLICPECGHKITADQINIQALTAVCGACHTVFKFDTPTAKRKNRSSEQPTNLKVIQDGERLRLRFRTNFRLDKNANLLLALLLAVTLTIASANLIEEYFTAAGSFILPVLTTLGALAALYQIALIIFNETVIEMDAHQIQHDRQPLPGLSFNKHKLLLDHVASFFAEETSISRKEAYDTPRFHVYARLEDGRSRIVIENLIEEYAVFIAERLNMHLQGIDQLEDVADEAGEDFDSVEAASLAAKARLAPKASLAPTARLADINSLEESLEPDQPRQLRDLLNK